MKLTKAQERVLRTMHRHDCEIGESRLGGKTSLQYEPRVAEPAPRKATMQVLERHGLVWAYPLSWFCCVYWLTYLGCEAAKRLQGAQ